MKEALGGFLLAVALALFGYAVINTAWLSDDAYISFRTVDNLLNGFGLTWNIDERVQAYTNPLWVLLNAATASLNPASWHIYFSSLATSVTVTYLALLLLAFEVARGNAVAVFCIIALTFCRAFVDYTTSGLENPMTHLLLAVAMLAVVRTCWTTATIFVIALCAGLSMTNRMDTALLYAPVLAYAWLAERNRRAALAILAGLLPFIAWEIFAFIYYGFPFPNTAYAKLGSGTDKAEIIVQGGWYLWNAVVVDPLTPLLTLLGLLVAPFVLRDARYSMLAIGGVLYVAYIVWSGGDFMQGRFLTPPLFLAVLLLARMPAPRAPLVWASAAVVAVFISASAPNLSLFTGERFGGKPGFMDVRKVGDERKYYMFKTGLRFWDRQGAYPSHEWAEKGRMFARRNKYQSHIKGAVGMVSYFSGPRIRIIDHHALADPLLARLPAYFLDDWRIGHFDRVVPRWYWEMFNEMYSRIQKFAKENPGVKIDWKTILENGLGPRIPVANADGVPPVLDADPDLYEYYRHLSLIVRGPLWSAERWRAIVAMNLGQFDHLINADIYRFPNIAVRHLHEVDTPRAAGSDWAAPGNVHLPASGVEIRLDGLVHNSQVEISVDHDENYALIYRKSGNDVAIARVDPKRPPRGGLQVVIVDTPVSAIRSGYDAVIVAPAGGDSRRALGHFRLL
jgi:arabinofuranosyltransferase